MNLSLEETVVLTNVPEWDERKSKIIEEAMQMHPRLEWPDVMRIMESLVVRKLIDRNAGRYKIRQEGLKALNAESKSLTKLAETVARFTSLR